jgi:hypothetical protein
MLPKSTISLGWHLGFESESLLRQRRITRPSSPPLGTRNGAVGNSDSSDSRGGGGVRPVAVRGGGGGATVVPGDGLA